MYSRLIRVERPRSPSSPRRIQARKDLVDSGTTSGDTENLTEMGAGMFETYKGKASSVTTIPEENLMENKRIAQVVIKKLFIRGVANKTSLLKVKEAEMLVWKDIEMHKSIAQDLIIKSFQVAHFILFLTILIDCYRFDSSKKRRSADEKSPFSQLGIPSAANEGGEYHQLKKRKPGTTPKVPDKRKRLKVDERCYFSDLTEEQLIPLFSQVRKFRFVPCKVYLSYNTDDATREVSWHTPTRTFYTYDLPKNTAHCKLGSGHHQLFGSIQAAGVSLDPASPSFSIFNHKYNDPILVPQLGSLSPHFISYCSIPFSTSVKMAAKLYVTTDKLDDMEHPCDYYDCYRGKDPTERFNDAFEVCNDCAVINFSENFAKRPNGGSGSYTLKGRDGHLKMYYVALKYAVDAALEVVFDATSEETKVAGRVMAYYGKNFDYGCSPAEQVDYKAMLFETEQNEVIKPGKINLMRSVLSVPAQFSLVIDAHLTDSTSGGIILSGVYEFLVPTDGSISVGCIKGNDCSLKLKVDWQLPPFAEETTPAKRPYYSELSKKQLFAERSIYAPVSMHEEVYRWSLQEKISKAFSYFLHGSLHCEKGAVSISISTGTKADDCDYLCTSVLNIWPELRSKPHFEGPKSAGLVYRVRLLYFPQARMLERCVVGGPGFLKFKLSGKWIAKSIYKMLLYGIDIWAPRLPMKKTIINFSRNIAKEMCMDHLRCTILGETLARTLKYSGVCVRQRFHDWDHLDIKSKKMMTEYLIDRFPNEEVNDQAILELEVLYEESKKRFEEDADFRNRTQQGWDTRHKNAWVQICKISRERYQERYQEVYQRLGVHVEEEDKSLHDSISQTKSLLEKQGFTIESEGDEAIFFEERKLHLVDLASLWHALEKEKADRIVHVADVGQRDKIEMCITAVKSAGLIVTNHAHDPLSHVGFRTSSKVVNLDNLLEEAKSHCKAVLVRQGTTLKDKELEHAAEALGYGAVKYAGLKNNRLTNYTFSFTEMFNENMFKKKGNTAAYLQYTYARICKIKGASKKQTAKLEVETLTLKDGKERELGLHLLRFTEVLGKVCRVLAPHIMCEYLYVLCKKFDELYSPGWQVESGEDSKLLLCEATKVVMRKCFYLLGITPIYKF